MTGHTAAGVPTRLEDLEVGLKLSGLLPEPVSILAVTTHGPDAVTVTFQDVNGTLGQRLLYRADEAVMSIESPTTRWRFDADPAEFRLAAEALRIRMAGLHDPMVAVSSSAVEPLPHQIRAVYGELLPRPPHPRRAAIQPNLPRPPRADRPHLRQSSAGREDRPRPRRHRRRRAHSLYRRRPNPTPRRARHGHISGY
jgi:hypothetical protein